MANLFSNFINSFKAELQNQEASIEEARRIGLEQGRRVAAIIYHPCYAAGYVYEGITTAMERNEVVQDIVFSAQKGFEDGRAAKVYHDAEKALEMTQEIIEEEVTIE